MPVLAFEDARNDSCDPQLGDTWWGMQGKMSVTAPVKKIRKKSDSKPQSQINKCINEKRRRELENETINQLEELLGTCLAEVKQPDKNGIVREATRQIQEVLKRRRECSGECPLRARPEPVQAGEVSSTQPQPLPPGLHYSETTTLIEALKHYTNSLGWVLLEINSEGQIICVTENIKDIILQDRTELKSIFSILHDRDHAKIKPLLRNIKNFGWATGDSDKFQAIQARLAIANSNGTDDAKYVEAVIHCAPVRGSSAEAAGSVMCVIRRCEDASAALLPAPLPRDGGPPHPASHTDQIVFRLDCNFNILNCDLSGAENLVGSRYLELVDSSDRVRVAAHLKSASGLTAPPAVSEPFRLRLLDRPLRVIAQTRLFRTDPTAGDLDFIMSTHIVLDDEALLEAGAAPPPRAPMQPLLPSLSNGDAAFRAAMSPADLITMNDFDLDPWTVSNFQISEMSGDESKETKDSMSEGPSTPRTPATPGDAPPPLAPADDRLRSLLTASKPPQDADSNNRLLKVLLKQEDEEATSSETSAPHTPLTPHTPAALSPHHPARPALNQLAAHSAHSSHSHSAHSHALPPTTLHSLQPMHHNNSDILSRILNKSDDDAEDNRRNSQDSGRGSSQPSVLSQLLSTSNGPSNNGRSHESDRDHYFQGNKRKYPEESKGCSTSNVKRATPEIQQVSSSAATGTCSSSATSPSTSGAGMSPLCAKNQILVSLLARQQTTPTTPLPLPNPSLRPYAAPRPRAPPPAHPQAQGQPQQQQQQRHLATLSNMLSSHSRPSGVNGGASSAPGLECGGGGAMQSHLQLVLQGGARGAYPPAPNPPPSPLHYAASPHHVYTPQPQPQQDQSRSQAGQGSQSSQGGDGEVPSSDKTLSDILDAVIENMPDAERGSNDVSVLLDLETCQLKQDFSVMKNTNRDIHINAIRQSLMLCETATKSPVSTSPGPPPVYSVQNMPPSMGGGSGALYSTSGVDPARARVVEQRARLLDLQRSQQMLVSREAAEQPQADLGSTINALVSATPPNVALQRTDYHHYIHPSNQQMGSNYGTNKITSTQQNPMLSRQLSGSGGYAHAHAHAHGHAHAHAAHAPAALHTPLSQRAPYHRPPRPQLVGGYYDEGARAAYCGEYAHARRTPHAAHASHAPHTPHQNHPSPHDQVLSCAGNGGGVVGVVGAASAGGAGGAGGTSEYVRNELRAVVGARSARPDLHAAHQDLDPLMTFDMTPTEYYGGGLGGGGIGGGR